MDNGQIPMGCPGGILKLQIDQHITKESNKFVFYQGCQKDSAPIATLFRQPCVLQHWVMLKTNNTNHLSFNQKSACLLSIYINIIINIIISNGTNHLNLEAALSLDVPSSAISPKTGRRLWIILCAASMWTFCNTWPPARDEDCITPHITSNTLIYQDMINKNLLQIWSPIWQ